VLFSGRCRFYFWITIVSYFGVLFALDDIIPGTVFKFFMTLPVLVYWSVAVFLRRETYFE
jgi:hypothetical protein